MILTGLTANKLASVLQICNETVHNVTVMSNVVYWPVKKDGVRIEDK